MAEAAEGSPEPLAALRRAYGWSYGLGLALCGGGPLLLQVLLGRVIPPGTQEPAAVEQVGYAFTGLTFLAAALALGRRGRVLEAFRHLEPGRRPAVLAREILRVAALSATSSLWGLLYWGLAGGGRNAYARTFIALTLLLFLGFAPRWAAWRKALEA